MIDPQDEKTIIKKVLSKLNKGTNLDVSDVTHVVDYHTHNGIDSPQINFKDLLGRQISYNNISGTPAPIPVVQNDWQFDGVFSSSGSNSVAWTAGTFKDFSGTTYSIATGDTGTMSAFTYIYFDATASLTVLQITTVATSAVGSGKVLIGVAQASGGTGSDSIFNDNFNSYSNGTICGVGSWTCGAAGAFNVESTVVNEGAHAIKSGGSDIAKSGTSVNDGTQTIYARFGTGGGGSIRFKEGGSGTSFKINVDINGNVPGKIAYYDNTLGVYVSFADLALNVWFAIQVQWRSSDHKARFNINGGTWTSYIVPYLVTAWTSGLDTIHIFDGSDINRNFWVDTIQGPLFSGDSIFQIFGGSGGIKINGTSIVAGTISASELLVSQLSDITPTLGTITSGIMSGITGFALRDTSAAFDVTIASTSSVALTAGRTLTIDMADTAHTLKFGVASTLTFPTGTVTIPSTSNNLSVFAATTSAQLAGVISDETGSGLLVFQTSPTIITPIIAKLANLTTNGFVKTSGGDGTLSVDTNTYARVVASTFEKAETGTDSNILTYTTGGSDEFLIVQVATDVSAITGTSIVVTVTWKDSNNSTATSTLTLTAVGDGTINIPINSKASQNVVVSSVFIGVSTAYNISVFLTKLN